MYIALEGIDGCGKSTIHKLLKQELFNKYPDISFIREPGTTDFAEEIRRVTFAHFNSIRPMTVQLAMLAARSDIRIRKEALTISDRCFLSACYCEELKYDEDISDWINISLKFITKPNIIIFFDITEQTSVDRLKGRKDKNGYDTENLNEITLRIQSYKRWIHIVNEMCPDIKIITVNANRPLTEVLNETLQIITENMECQEMET